MEWLVGRQVDMKIVFYELIRMITGYEREKCMYDLTRSVGEDRRTPRAYKQDATSF